MADTNFINFHEFSLFKVDEIYRCYWMGFISISIRHQFHESTRNQLIKNRRNSIVV